MTSINAIKISQSDKRYIATEQKELALINLFDPRKNRLFALEKRIVDLKRRTLRILANEPVYRLTYAEKVGKPLSCTKISYIDSEVNKCPQHILTTYEARLDYEQAYDDFLCQKYQARLLCESIARRSTYTPRRKRKLRSKVDLPLTDEQWLSGYTHQEIIRDTVKIQLPEEPTNTFLYKHSGKSFKHKTPWECKQPIYPEIASCTPPPSPIWTRQRKQSFLINILSRTIAGRMLLIGYMNKKLGDPESLINMVSEVNDLVNSLPDEYGEDSVELLESQMDDRGAVGLTATAESKSSNTVIDSVQVVDKGIENPTISGFKHLAVSREKQTFETFYDRWIYVNTFKWEAKDGVNKNIFSLELPYDVLKGNENSQNAQLFLTNRYFRTDIVLKFNCNSNTFQIGQLVIGVVYGNLSEGLDHCNNVYSALQRNHVRIVAGASNDTELTIPYHYMNSMLALRPSSNFVTVVVYVLNPLLATGNTVSTCNISVFATFKKAEFYGMISRLTTLRSQTLLEQAMLEPQMEDIGKLIHVGSSFLNSLDKDFNRDNPPQPLQPISFMPTGLTSMCYMDHIRDPVNVLRADPRGQRPTVTYQDEMNPLSIARVFGFIKTIKWNSASEAGNAAGYTLLSLPVVPLMDSNKYETEISRPIIGVRGFVPTPLAFISSLAGKFRGDIKFKFEVIASRFHSGRVIVGSVPLSTSSSISISDLKYSAYKVFDIQDSTVFEFNAPWQWFNSFANVRRTESGYDIPSRVYMKIVNPLINVAQVPSTVYINVYVAAGDNFELALPRPPILDPFFTIPLVPPPNEHLKPYDTQAAIFGTYNRQVSGHLNIYPLIPYYGSVIGDWIGYTNVQSDTIYRLSGTLSDGITGFQLLVYRKDLVLVEVRYAAFCPDLTTATSHGIVLFDDASKAKAYVKEIAKSDWDHRVAYDLPLTWYKDGPWANMKIPDSPGWVPADNDHGYPVWEFYEDILPEAQMDDRDPVPLTVLDIPSASSNQGLLVYGESFPDLKSLCRRYNHYGTILVETQTIGNPRDLPYAAQIRVNPMRKLMQGVSSSYDNRYRHGVITSIGSMFRGYIGGLRFWFVVVGAPPEGTTLYVQHRFDLEMGDLMSDVKLGPNKVSSRDDMMNTQYATSIQALSVNSCLSVEVPNYKEQEFLSTLPLSNSYLKSNGSLLMWLHSKVKSQIHFEIYYSVADDFRYTVFQGTPVSFDISTLAPEPQMDVQGVLEEIPLDDTPTTSKISQFLEDERLMKAELESPKPQSLRKRISKLFATPSIIADSSVQMTKSVAQASDALQQTSSKLSKFMDDLKSFGTKQKEKISSSATLGAVSCVTDLLMGLKDKVFKVVSHIVYMIISPTIKTILWGLVNIYHSIFGFTLDGFEKLSQIIQRIWERIRWSTQQPQTEQPQPQMDDESSDIGGYASLLFAGISTLCCLKTEPPKSWEGIGKSLFRTSQNVRGSYFLKVFINDNFELFKRVVRKFTSMFSSKGENFKLISGMEDDRLKRWLMETQIVLNPQYEERIYGDRSWSQKVFELTMVGRAIEIAGLDSTGQCSRVMVIVRDNLKALKTLEKKLMDMHVYSGVRYEPWCLWVNGEEGRGKTRYLQHFADLTATECKYTGPVSYCSMTAGQKYFDSWIGQPTIMLDDFCTVSPSVEIDSYYQFIQMKSSAIFNPPFAIAEEKNKLVNFQNLFISANRLYFDGLTGLENYGPYNRRRDVLISFEFKDPCMTPELAKRLTQLDFDSLNHIQIKIHENVCSVGNPSTHYLQVKSDQTVREALDAYLIRQMRSYHAKEMSCYSQRCQAIVNRIESLTPSSMKFESVLAEYSRIVTQQKDSPNLLASWLRRTELSASYIPDIVGGRTEETIQPQGDDSPIPVQNPDILFEVWPHKIPDDIDGLRFTREFKIGETIHPLERDIPYTGSPCLHMSFDYPMGLYDKELDIYYSSRCHGFESNIAYSVSHDTCKTLDKDGNFVKVGSCIMDNPSLKRKFYYDIIYKSNDESLIQQLKASAHSKQFGYFNDNYHPDIVRFIRDIVLSTSQPAVKPCIARGTIRALKIAQNAITGQFEVIADEVVPKESRVKTIPQKLWGYIKTILASLYIGMRVLITVAALFASVGLFASMFSTSNLTEPQIHPSGDYKTIKSAKSIRTRSLKLVEGNNSGCLIGSPIEACNLKRQNQGLLNKVVKNTFFLVGTVPTETDNQVISYKARCVGLYNKKFLVLKHYIEHFKSVGVIKVHVVYHNAVGSIAYNLDEINFKWTEQGYGIGELPKSAPRQFSDITKYIPSDKFSGEYPADVIILEVFNDQVVEYNTVIQRLQTPLIVPQSSTQSSWKISQGFKYNWGGKGRCGSLIIAPSMACPLIGIHTAGVGDKIGYGEILLSETFIDNIDETIIEYVTPNMDLSPSVYGLDGYYEEIGQLEPNVTPKMSRKTRIRPSDIHGVFPITTEPAPLDNLDPRLCEKGDILRIGVSKRCDPMVEFNSTDVQTSYLDYVNFIRFNVLPKRANMRPLSVVEAIEGFPIEGYESITMSTSEGYPWVNLRPIGKSDKSWMFQISAYDSGRIKIEGIWGKLSDVLDLKDSLRKEGKVPATYYTTCLKDARISKDKIHILGKTRVFEMSPIELTIVQRQYFIDWTVAYQQARLKAENSIGINCDGEEWTQLANWLLDWSPHILTADFSGYGPRISHTILEKAFDATTAWLDYHEELPEEIKEENFLIREVLKHEVSHGLHIVKDLVFRPTSGLPSGNVETVEKNSQCNSLYWRIAYLSLARQYAPKFADLYFYYRFIRLVHNGDDVIVAVKPEIIEWFNNETLIFFFGEYGLKMTDALKQGVVRKYCTLEEATYLKRGFLRHPKREGQWLAPLEKSSITDTANWIWSSVDNRQASLVNSEMSCRLAYTQGPEFYHLVASSISDYWSKLNVRFMYPSWDSLDMHIWEKSEGPTFCF